MNEVNALNKVDVLACVHGRTPIERCLQCEATGHGFIAPGIKPHGTPPLRRTVTGDALRLRAHSVRFSAQFLASSARREQLKEAANLMEKAANELDETNRTLKEAMKRMDTARSLLTNDNPRPNCYWGMLDSNTLGRG